MIISIPIQDFNKECIYFGDYIKNIVIQNSFFIRLFYSTEHLTINGIYITFPIAIESIEKSYNNRIMCYYKQDENRKVFEKIMEMEEDIIKKINITNKTPEFSIRKLFLNNHIKIYDQRKDYGKTVLFNCKISGIWDNGEHYGLTFKINVL